MNSFLFYSKATDALSVFTHKQLETQGCVKLLVPVSTVAADGLVLKHQAISIHNTDWTPILSDLYHKNGHF